MIQRLTFHQLFGIAFVGFCLLLAASMLSAWTGPTASPPNGNISAPINVGAVDQVKNAGLSLNALTVFGGTYVQGNLGVGVVASGAQLDVNGTVRVRGGGTPAAGKILVAGDSSGNLVWGTLSYQAAGPVGPVTLFHISSSQTAGSALAALVQDLSTNGGVTANSSGSPYNDSITRARLCVVLAGSSAATVNSYGATSYNGNYGSNYVYKWQSPIWKQYSAIGNNSFVATITCDFPGGAKITTDFGDIYSL